MTRPWCWLSTLRRGHCWHPRKTRFRRLARPCRVGLVTHRVATKGFKDATPYPPFLSFAWRNVSSGFHSYDSENLNTPVFPAGEVGVDFKAVEVADDEQRRVFQGPAGAGPVLVGRRAGVLVAL